jgi:3-hydroxybutyryl-CoA dehydrogenase
MQTHNVAGEQAAKAVHSDALAGVIGLGLMGTSITAALLAAGHPVTSLSIDAKQRENAPAHIVELLRELKKEGMLSADAEQVIKRLRVTEDYKDFADCQIVIESIIEDLPAKRGAIRKTEEVVSAEALIGSNTSAIPVTLLQQGAIHPERILGIHWAEPAHVTRFMEIISGDESSLAFAERAVEFARGWGKEPTLVRKDIRGFITNRIMYAMLREAFFLVENGYATVADVDRSVRNDMGFWMTLAGPFRFMDLTGIPAYRAVMKDLLPELSCDTQVPQLMEKVVSSGALGVANGHGFYEYTPEQAKRWEEIFLKFTYDIRALAQKYPESIAD